MASTSSYSSLKFPQKLWNIINECESGAISWDTSGKVILINYRAFRNEYLDSEFGFKTSNITSFIRQLNLYGFRKLPANFSKEWDRNMHAYHNENFVSDNKRLLSYVTRKPSGVKRQKKKIAFRSKFIPQSNRLTFCQKVLSKALTRAACKNGFVARRKLFVTDGLDQNLIMKANQILRLPLEKFQEDESEEDYPLSSVFFDDSSFMSDSLDTIPIVLPPDLERYSESMHFLPETEVKATFSPDVTPYATKQMESLKINQQRDYYVEGDCVTNPLFQEELIAISTIDCSGNEELLETISPNSIEVNHNPLETSIQDTYLYESNQSTFCSSSSSNVIVESVCNPNYVLPGMFDDCYAPALPNDALYHMHFSTSSLISSTMHLLTQ